MVKEHRYPNIDACVGAAAQVLAESLRDGIRDRGEASLAISGGRTAERLLPYLAVAEMAWNRVAVTLIDERWVDPGHPDSNEGLARKFLFRDRAQRATFIGLKTAAETPKAGLAEAEERLDGMQWPLDGVFLGMGEDGHIASMFPGDLGWDGVSRLIPVAAEGERRARMSLSPAALLDARHIVLVVVGPAKVETYEQALAPGPATELPVRLALHQERAPVSVFVTS